MNNPGYRKLLEPSAVTADVVPVHESGGVGAPCKLEDPKVYKTIVETIRKGNFLSVAARRAGVTPHSIKSWLQKGQEGHDDLYYRFWQDIRQAEAESESNLVENIMNQSEHDWRAAIAVLERKWPERWGKVNTVNQNVNVSGSIQHEVLDDISAKVLDDIEYREEARALIEGTVGIRSTGGTS